MRKVATSLAISQNHLFGTCTYLAVGSDRGRRRFWTQLKDEELSKVPRTSCEKDTFQMHLEYCVVV